MQTLVFDSEVYRDYYLAAFMDVDSREKFAFEMFDGQRLDTKGIADLVKGRCLVTFNGNSFDLPLLMLATKGADCARIKEGCDAIIGKNLRGWQFEQMFGIKVPKLNHVDLIEVAPGRASLKIYGGRLHCQRMQDLPIEPNASIAPEQRQLLRTYCGNDLDTTALLYQTLKPQIELRQKLGEKYRLELRSKSDAQIAEAVICSSVERISKAKVDRPIVPSGTMFRYKIPGWLSYTTAPLRELLEVVRGLDFVVTYNGGVLLPPELADREIKIGSSVYRMGIGGLHSSEQRVAHKADGQTVLSDRDVASYYPAIILQNNLAPQHMGEHFTTTFQALVDQRLAAKRAGDKVTADSLKITVNGSFGKLGSVWSKLYSPDLLIQTTITGQLALLMLIEALEGWDIHVVSANTDGVVSKCPADAVDLMDAVVGAWERQTGFETEATEYSALYSRDVNNYIAVKKGGGVKLKGAYAPVGLQKNPTNEIATEAAVRFLANGTAVEKTIFECRDIRKFVTVRKVAGGAQKDGVYLGKAVRWYYSIASAGPIKYRDNGYTVARSEGAEPLMELPTELPPDIDYGWYIVEANSILKDVGALQ